jgi:MoaD family protein
MVKRVKVEFIGVLREVAGTNEITLDLEDNATLKDVMEKLADKYGRGLETRILEENRVSDDALVIINGKSIRSTDVSSIAMRNGDEIALAPESSP